MKSLEEAPFLNVFAPEFHADPAAALAPLRAQSWIVRTPIGALVISREKVLELLNDERLRSPLLDIARMQGLRDGPLYEGLSRTLLAVDGPDHTRLRKLVSRAFTPRSVEKLRPFMRELAEELIDRFASRGRCELMADLADAYPIQVICELLGVPREDHDKFARWSNALTYVLSFDLSAHMDEVHEAFAGMGGYVEGLIAARRREPRDDLVTALTLAEDDGDRLSAVELLAMIGGLLFAGYDTTRNQLGIAMFTFAQHPDQWRLLRERPELAASAAEESLRFLAAVAVAPRFVEEEIVVADYVLPKGTLLSLGTGAANHDPAAFHAPECFDISAAREPQVSFGGGAHYCLGANLARAELQETLPLLARSMPDLRLDGEVEWRPRVGIFGPTRLPLAFTAVSGAGVAVRTSAGA